jgi:dTDP-glucose 4,6-dehydratase
MAPAAAYWSGRRVLVTGAGGFIGSHVVERLVRSGASVRAFIRYTSRPDHGCLTDLPVEIQDQVEVYRGDLANPEALNDAVAGTSVVLALGALIAIPYSYRHPREYVFTNVEGVVNVLEACRRHEVERLVHTSTSEVYGTAQRVPIDEDHPLQAQSPYAATKVAADQLALSYWRTFSTPVVVARPFNTYGPRQSARAVIPTIVTQALVNDTVRLGNLESTRDFTYVTDTVRGFLHAGETPEVEGKTFNLGTGREISVGDLARKIIAMLDLPVEIVLDEGRLRPRGSEVMRLISDNSLAKQSLSWQPEVSLEQGLERTIEWIREHLDLYRVGRYEF